MTTSSAHAPPACLPLGEPFTLAMAIHRGVSRKAVAKLVSAGLLRRPLRNVYVSTHLPDSLQLRAEMLALVVPADAFVCDRTAAWLHAGAATLAPNEHLSVPPVSCFRPSGRTRLRNGLVVSGERAIRPKDLMEIHGVLATTPLRTAVDLGRLQPTADLPLAGMDAMARIGGFTAAELVGEVERFARQRGVILLRELAPLVDPGAQSQGESALRLRWHTAGLPPPQTQVEVTMDDGSLRYLDIGTEEWLFAAEYDGKQWHSSDKQVDHDGARRGWIRKHRGWVIEAYRSEHVYGRKQDADYLLRDAFAAARASYPSRTFII